MTDDSPSQPGNTTGATGTQTPPNGRFATGQTKYADVFTRQRAEQFRYIYGIGWHQWDGQRWTPCLKEEQRESLKAMLVILASSAAQNQDQAELKALTTMMTSSAQAGILSISQHSPTMARAANEMDSDPWLLNTASGVVDLMTGTLRPATPADNVTKVTRAGFNPNAELSTWQAFLDKVMPNKAIQRYLQQYVGLSLLGVVREHILAIATGTGANGKSTFVEAVSHALGDYAHTAEQYILMATRDGKGGATPELAALRGTRWVVTSETDEGAKLNSSVTKQVTGGDTITARGLYKDPITFAPSWTILMVTNHLPLVRANDDAVWRRIRVIPFDVVIPADERDPSLGEQLKLQADAILTWAVAGLQQYLRNGNRLDTPPEVDGATRRYRNDSDDISKFLDARAELGPQHIATRAQIWAAWQSWAKSENAAHIKQSELYTALELRGCTSSTPTIDGKRARAYTGLKILPDDEAVEIEDTILFEEVRDTFTSEDHKN